MAGQTITRRQFFKVGAGTCVALMAPKLIGCGEATHPSTTTVYAVLGDELSALYEMAKQAATQLGITGSSMTGATVFIKPNFCTMGLDILGTPYDPLVGECTKPEIVAAVAEQCLAAGAAKVTIGEGAHVTEWDWSTVTFVPGNSIEGATDLKAAADRLQTLYPAATIELVCLNQANEWTGLPSSSGDPLLADGIPVATRLCDADHVISCPVVKSHLYAAVSLAMKNYVGAVSMMGDHAARCKLHQAYAHATCHGVAEAGVSGSYVDIHQWRRDQGKQDFAIVDCSIGLEGGGPTRPPTHHGSTIDIKSRNAASKYFLLAGDDLAAVDSMTAQLMGFTVAELKQMALLDALGYTSIHDVVLSGASVDEIAIRDWLKPTLESEDFFFQYCT